jgi:hypothetical protein
MSVVILQLADQIKSHGSCGEIIFHIEHWDKLNEEADSDIADRLVEQLGFQAPGDWRIVDREKATNILYGVLHRDLAYYTPVMPINLAHQLAEQFFQLFDFDTTFLTNGQFEPSMKGEGVELRGWTPISDATFDTGIVCVSNQHVGMLWVQDED